MSIQGIDRWRKALLAVGGACFATGAICLAYGNGREQTKPPVSIIYADKAVQMAQSEVFVGKDPAVPITEKSGRFVASKSGKRYYPAGCSGAKRISSANLVAYDTEEQAQAAGLTRAAGCQF